MTIVELESKLYQFRQSAVDFNLSVQVRKYITLRKLKVLDPVPKLNTHQKPTHIFYALSAKNKNRHHHLFDFYFNLNYIHHLFFESKTHLSNSSSLAKPVAQSQF
ncbi:hypothetical protein [Pseudomonas sp. 10-1B]|uniref:hypothetical protein n=1 Tax=Pseudomonas sp. 10-1B TaxID=1546029 RepID=UPI00128DC699|nr:hypothetical protein [Pseudomonas sp. 10-1B]